MLFHITWTSKARSENSWHMQTEAVDSLPNSVNCVCRNIILAKKIYLQQKWSKNRTDTSVMLISITPLSYNSSNMLKICKYILEKGAVN